MTKHTPRPWFRSQKNGRLILDINGKKIATAERRPNGPEAWDNARLLLAAPDLLATLISVENDVRQRAMPDLEEIRAAIRKATEEPTK